MRYLGGKSRLAKKIVNKIGETEMQYLGGKSRLARRIVDAITTNAESGSDKKPTVFEPFCGGGAVTYALARQGYQVIASDVFPGLAEMHRACCTGFRIDRDVTDEVYQATKNKTDIFSVAVQFGVSFGGKYGGGLARPSAKYVGHFNSWAQKMATVKDRIEWAQRDYRETPIVPGTLIYCDPPYAGTESYQTGKFDHAEFWTWAHNAAAQGVSVYVSEFSAPADLAQCILEIPRKIALSHTKESKVDRLYRVNA